MKNLREINAQAILLKGDNIDTDRIIPAQYVVSRLTFNGIEDWVFNGDRAMAAKNGLIHPFDRSPKPSEAILIVEENFGCGSSREHAPQALARWGIRAIIGRSFGDIFYRNSNNIGLICCTVASSDIDRYEGWSLGAVGCMTLDIQTETAIHLGGPLKVNVPQAVKKRLLSGNIDTLSQMYAMVKKASQIEARLPYINHWTSP